MNISMYTTYALELDKTHPTKILRHFYERGVSFGDIIDDELKDVPLREYCSYLRDAGMSPDALVSTRDVVTSANNEEALHAVFGRIDEMEKLGVPMLMLAPSLKFDNTSETTEALREKMIISLGKIIEYAKGTDISVMIENQSTSRRPDSKISDLRHILDSLPELGFVLDSGNFFCVGEDVTVAYTSLRDRMIHAHVKDWRFNPNGAMIRENIPRFEGCAIGDGFLPLDKLFEKMRSDKYSGNVVLEVNARNITLDLLDKSCDYLLKHTSG